MTVTKSFGLYDPHHGLGGDTLGTGDTMSARILAPISPSTANVDSIKRVAEITAPSMSTAHRPLHAIFRLVPHRTVQNKMNCIQQIFVFKRFGEEGCRPLG